MSTISPRRTLREIANLGTEIFETRISLLLRPEDKGRFVSIDVNTGEFEVADDDYSAFSRLRSRKPDAEIFLMRAGYAAACRI